MTSYLAYIRVSTARQGDHGVSLQEQRDDISRYAARHNLTIIEWIEERLTASKRGRPLFTRLMTRLLHARDLGVILHKVDRTARNYHDWADIGALLDRGVDVHLAHESLDLKTRAGRLTADMLAVFATDYIRNLSEEARKGYVGRVKQGIFPAPAPVG